MSVSKKFRDRLQIGIVAIVTVLSVLGVVRLLEQRLWVLATGECAACVFAGFLRAGVMTAWWTAA